MSDETKTGNSPQDGGGGETPKTFTQSDVDGIINKRFAEFKSLQEENEAIKAERDKLAQEKKKREEAQMSEIDKIKSERDELKKEMDTISKERDKFAEFQKSWEEKEQAKVEKALADIPEEQQQYIKKLPLADQMGAIQTFYNNRQVRPGDWGKSDSKPKDERQRLREQIRSERNPRKRQELEDKYIKLA